MPIYNIISQVSMLNTNTNKKVSHTIGHSIPKPVKERKVLKIREKSDKGRRKDPKCSGVEKTRYLKCTMKK